MKGIILAGGKGTRLYPMTKVISKQIIPIYDKPMIYYPLSILMLAGIKDVLIISTERDVPMFKNLLGDGRELGMNFEYKVQKEPKGLAEAFIIGEEFVGNDDVCLILGDNIFYGGGITESVMRAMNNNNGATIFGCYVKNPREFGVAEFDSNGKVISIEEKPQNPKSNYAVPGLYFYDNEVVKISKSIKPSARGELEITAVNNEYLKKGKLKLEVLNRGVAWLDTGTTSNLNQASSFVETIQTQQGNYIACLEEIAYRKGFITLEQLKTMGEELKSSDYGKYILDICDMEEKNHE